jgi:hypothetical protein
MDCRAADFIPQEPRQRALIRRVNVLTYNQYSLGELGVRET